MKTWKLLLALPIVFCLCFAGSIQQYQAQIIKMKKAAGGGCDDCSGDLKFAWHAENVDVELGTPCGCSDGDTTAVEAGDEGVELSSTQKSDGTYSIHVSGAQDFYEFTISTSDIVNVNELKITFDIWLVTYAAGTVVFSASHGAGEEWRIEWAESEPDRLRSVHDGSGSSADTVRATKPDTGVWKSCEVKLKTGVEGNDHYINLAEDIDEDDDDLTDITTAPTTFIIGNNTDNAGAYYLDNIKIYGTSGY